MDRKLVHEWGDKIAQFALALTHDPDAAQAIAQETFVRLERWHAAHPERPISGGWLYTTARHLIVDQSRRRRPEVSWEDYQGTKPVVPGFGDWRPRASPYNTSWTGCPPPIRTPVSVLLPRGVHCEGGAGAGVVRARGPWATVSGPPTVCASMGRRVSMSDDSNPSDEQLRRELQRWGLPPRARTFRFDERRWAGRRPQRPPVLTHRTRYLWEGSAAVVLLGLVTVAHVLGHAGSLSRASSHRLGRARFAFPPPPARIRSPPAIPPASWERHSCLMDGARRPAESR